MTLSQAPPTPWGQATLRDVHGLFIHVGPLVCGQSSLHATVALLLQVKRGECPHSTSHWLSEPRLGQTSCVFCACLPSEQEREGRSCKDAPQRGASRDTRRCIHFGLPSIVSDPVLRTSTTSQHKIGVPSSAKCTITCCTRVLAKPVAIPSNLKDFVI